MLQSAVPPLHTMQEASDYFSALCRDAGCPRCGREDSYVLKSGRLRCPQCGYTFHRFSRRFINRGSLPPEYWHAILHYFIDGLPPHEAASRLALTYATVFKAYATIRLAIAANSEDAHRLIDDKGEPLRFCPVMVNDAEDRPLCLNCASPVIGVRENGHGVRLRLLTQLAAQGVFAMPLRLKTWRSLVYTEAFQEFDALIFCCCRTARTLFQAKFTRDSLRLDATDFMAFAEAWFSQYHCLSPENSFAYLKEIEFRFNHRDTPLYPLLAKTLCSLVPKRAD